MSATFSVKQSAAVAMAGAFHSKLRNSECMEATPATPTAQEGA